MNAEQDCTCHLCGEPAAIYSTMPSEDDEDAGEPTWWCDSCYDKAVQL